MSSIYVVYLILFLSLVPALESESGFANELGVTRVSLNQQVCEEELTANMEDGALSVALSALSLDEKQQPEMNRVVEIKTEEVVDSGSDDCVIYIKTLFCIVQRLTIISQCSVQMIG